MSAKYERPVLTSIFYVLGVFALLAAVFCLFVSLPTAATVMVAGLMYFGIGQAVEYLARTAHSTDRLCTLLETSVSGRLKNIETSLNLATSSGAATQAAKGYYFSTDGNQQGPVSAADLRSMRKDGLVTDDTPVMREGETEWRTFKDFLALTR